MKLVWGARAKRDLRELVSYIAEDSIQAAEVVAGRILNTAEVLAKMPRSGRHGRVPKKLRTGCRQNPLHSCL